MDAPIYYKNNNSLFVNPKIASEWIIKIPTRENRLSKTGSAGLKISDRYELKHTKKGILFIDISAKAYVFIPKDCLEEPTPKDFQGVKGSILSYNVNKAVNDHNLEIVPIPKEGERLEKYDLGLAGEIRKRFGL